MTKDINLHAVCMYVFALLKDGYNMLLPISCNQQVSGN